MGQNKSGFVFWPISDFGADGALYSVSSLNPVGPVGVMQPQWPAEESPGS